MDRIDEILFLYEDDVVEMKQGGRFQSFTNLVNVQRHEVQEVFLKNLTLT